MIAFATRILATLALVAAAFWVVLPVVIVVSANPAHAASDPCPCCEGQAALGGVIACPGCQAGTPAESALPVRYPTVTAAWMTATSNLAPGLDPAPAEPPPR